MKEEQSCGDKRPSRLQCGLVRPYLPGLLSRMVTGEDTHGDHSCQMLFPWCRRMIVFMDPDGALWQRGGKTLPHLGEDTVAGCEMKLNKVTPTVIARPVTPLILLPLPLTGPCAMYEEYCICIYPLFEYWLGPSAASVWGDVERRGGKTCKPKQHEHVFQTVDQKIRPESCFARCVEKLVSPISPLWDSLSWTRLEVQLHTTRGQHASHRRALPDEPTPRAHDNLDDWSLSSRLRREGTERSAETTTTTKM